MDLGNEGRWRRGRGIFISRSTEQWAETRSFGVGYPLGRELVLRPAYELKYAFLSLLIQIHFKVECADRKITCNA